MNRSVCLVGLPGTGKTSYLAAFLHSVWKRRAPGAPRLESLPDAAKHMIEVHDAWLEGRPMPHTSVDREEDVELEIALEGELFSLRVPDLSGESFLRLLVDRQLAEALDELLCGAEGILLFLHPDQLRPRTTIWEAWKLSLALREDENREVAADAGGTPPAKPFDATTVPAEVLAVDLLQAVQYRRSQRGAPPIDRVAIILSAWDLMEGTPHADVPSEWMQRMMPMLAGFLASSPFAHSVFGVSAQGATLDPGSEPARPDDKAWFLSSTGEKRHDLFEPLLWALAEDV